MKTNLTAILLVGNTTTVTPILIVNPQDPIPYVIMQPIALHNHTHQNTLYYSPFFK